MTFDPAARQKWVPPADSPIGKRGLRPKDGHDKATGEAMYVQDISLPRMLYAKFLRSPYSQADIKNMDTSKAAKLPGVIDILRYDDPDIKDIKRAGSDPAPGSYTIYGLPGTADHYNHPMGVIVTAESEEICDEALRLIDIEWEEKQFYVEPEESMKSGAADIWYNTLPYPRPPGGNIIRDDQIAYGDTAKALETSYEVIQARIKREETTPAGVEPQCCVAYYKKDGYLDLWIKCQPTNAATEMAGLGLVDFVKVTTRVPYQGGWFGGISWLHWNNLFIYVATVVAKRVEGRPVKLIYDESNFYNMGDEYGIFEFKIGVSENGKINGVEGTMIGCREPMNKLYKTSNIKNILSKRIWPFVNRNNYCCFRHGVCECTAIDTVTNYVAAELNMDPTEVCLINDGSNGDDWETIKQWRIDNGWQNPEVRSMEEVLRIGKAAIDWDNKWHQPGTLKLPNGKMHGLGFTHCYVWHGVANTNRGAGLSYSGGVAYIRGQFSDIGVNAASARAATVAAESGLRYDDVTCRHFESELQRYAHSQPGGSLGTESNTPQMVLMARELKKRILQQAVTEAPGRPGAPPTPAAFPGKKVNELDIKDSYVFEISNPTNKKHINEVTKTSTYHVDASADLVPDHAVPYKYYMCKQAAFIEVEVDTDTGHVDIVNTAIVNDVGTVISPEGVEGQQYGGGTMALGKSLTEEIIRDPQTGVALNANLLGYGIFTMADLDKPIDCHQVETRGGNNAYGVTGIGESLGCLLAALTNAAIYNATGKWVNHIPTTPVRVLKALGKG